MYKLFVLLILPKNEDPLLSVHKTNDEIQEELFQYVEENVDKIFSEPRSFLSFLDLTKTEAIEFYFEQSEEFWIVEEVENPYKKEIMLYHQLVAEKEGETQG